MDVHLGRREPMEPRVSVVMSRAKRTWNLLIASLRLQAVYQEAPDGTVRRCTHGYAMCGPTRSRRNRRTPTEPP
jgi:hypothetical protein